MKYPITATVITIFEYFNWHFSALPSKDPLLFVLGACFGITLASWMVYLKP